ncbi:MAG: tRNA (adenosine(37)-N6)-threonylcarbamoyltransferase complex ATPase subunit type 1 TsaE [Acidiferrobacterales bacterium]
MHVEVEVPTVADMERLGARIAPRIFDVQLIYLGGALGTGKTTLVRGVLRALGHGDSVKSPTFTLMEPYSLGQHHVYHFDLYRLAHAEELEFIGFRDYVKNNNVCLVEWPERAAKVLPRPDLDILIRKVGSKRTVRLVSHTKRGKELLSGLG